jgi:hypothetical protein
MDVATQGAPSGDAAPVTAESLAGLFEAQLVAEREPPKAEKPAPAPALEEQQGETEAESPETEAEPQDEITADEAETADELEPEGEPDAAPARKAIDAPNGMSEADKAMFSKLPQEFQSWISGREAQQTADYTRKTMALAEQSKAVKQQSDALVGRLQQYDQILARFTDPEITPPDPALRLHDPAAYEEQLANFVHRKDLQEKAKAERARNAQEFEQHTKAQMRDYLAEQAQELQRMAPDLAANTPKAAEMRKAVHKYGVEQGYTPEMLAQASARDIVTLWKAQQYDAAQKAKANVKIVPKPAPKVVAPGPAKGGRPSNYAKAVQDLRSNPSVDALQAAFLAEIQAEKR